MAEGNITTLSQWDFEKFHVQREMDEKRFVNAASTLVAAGPPTIREAAGSTAAAVAEEGGAISIDDLNPGSAEFAYPIGVVENASINQNRTLQRIFEIGSKRSYFVPGRNLGSVTLARTLVHGPSLLRVLYAYYPKDLLGGSNNNIVQMLTHPQTGLSTINNNPGYSDFFINLDSDLFDHPMGLMVFFRDSNNQDYGAMYLEDCYINTHQINVASASVLILENTMIQFDRAVPINLKVKSTLQQNQQNSNVSPSSTPQTATA